MRHFLREPWLQEQGCGALVNCSKSGAESQRRITLAGGALVVVEAMRQHVGVITLQECVSRNRTIGNRVGFVLHAKGMTLCAHNLYCRGLPRVLILE